MPASHLAHFVLAAVEALDLREVKVNPRDTGDAQYPPTMLLGFRQFRRRGATKASTEWTLVCLAYNLRRLHTLGARAKLAVTR